MLHCIPKRILSGKRHLRILSQLIKDLPVQCKVHSAVTALYIPSNRDLPIPTQLTPVSKLYSNDTDILLEQIKKAKSIDRVLEMVSLHLDVMNDNHISFCFRIINEHIREKEILFQGNGDLMENVLFQSMCSHYMERVRYFEPEDIIAVCKTLTKLRVPSNTLIMQATLKMICSKINDLSLNQLTFINFLLAKHRPTALVDSLKLALPLVLQVQIDQQLDSDNIHEVISCLAMACKARLKPATIQKVISHLQRKVSEFTASNANDVIFGLFSLDTPVDGYMTLIKSCFDIITRNINDLPHSSLLPMTRICVKQSFCYPLFFTRICKKASSEYWPLEDCGELIVRMKQLAFFSPELLELVMERLSQNTQYVQEKSKFNISDLSECFSFADYVSTKSADALKILSSSSVKLEEYRKKLPHIYVNIISYWSVLGYFENDIMTKILDNNFLHSAWSSSRRTGQSQEFEANICRLQWALEVYGESEQFKIPKEFFTKVHHSVQQSYLKSCKFPLSKFIENGLGGPQFLRNAVLTRNGHVIDHIIAMRNGNYPAAFTPESSTSHQGCFIEDMQIPDDTKVIAVIVANNEDYCLGPEFLRGYMALKIKNLSKMSLYPVVINYDVWTSLPEREKISFLMKEIKQASENEHFTTSRLSTPQ